MTTATDRNLEARLRLACHEVIPHLLDEPVGALVPGGVDADLVPLHPINPTRFGHGRSLVLAAAAVLLVGVGVSVAVNRGALVRTSTGVANSTSTSQSSSSETIVSAAEPVGTVSPRPAVPGYYTLDASLDGLKLTDASELLAKVPELDSSLRIYSTTSSKPEQDPYVAISTMGTAVGMPAIPENAVTLPGGLKASQWTTGSRTNIALNKNGRWFLVVGSGIPNLAEIAASATVDEQSASAQIDKSLLPASVSEQSTGDIHEVRFVSREITTPGTTARWEGPSGGVWFESWEELSQTFRLHRIEYKYLKISDVSLNDHAAVLLTGDQPGGAGQFFSIMWNDGGRTTAVHGYGVLEQTVRNAAQRLRPATADEWIRMKADAAATRSQMAPGNSFDPSPAPTVFSMVGPATTRIEPRQATAGSLVSVTPAVSANRICGGGVVVYRMVGQGRFAMLGLVNGSRWMPPDTPIPACAPGPSAAAEKVNVPPLEPGSYLMCLGPLKDQQLDAEGCGELTIV